MNDRSPASNSRLSRIDTLWSVVHHSQDGNCELAITAQQQLLDIYGNAIKRYLLGALRNQELADELFQEFALKFIQGEFQNVDEAKGRFRSYVKTVLYRMVALHFRKKSASKEHEMPEGVDNESTGNETESQSDQDFKNNWREEILDQAWNALEDHEQDTGTPCFTILSVRVAEPELSSEAFAIKLSEQLGKPMKSGAARVSLHRAREKFANFVIDSVAQSLAEPTRTSVEEELIDLELIGYCRDALEATDFGSS